MSGTCPCQLKAATLKESPCVIESGAFTDFRGATCESVLALRAIRGSERTEKPPELVVIMSSDWAGREEIGRDNQRAPAGDREVGADWFCALGNVAGTRPGRNRAIVDDHIIESLGRQPVSVQPFQVRGNAEPVGFSRLCHQVADEDLQSIGRD